VIDNLAAPKAQAVREALARAGLAPRYLPPPDQVRGRLYSPDLNPIGPAWSKRKTSLRATGARTREAREQALGPRPHHRPGCARMVPPRRLWRSSGMRNGLIHPA
jgi:transposase